MRNENLVVVVEVRVLYLCERKVLHMRFLMNVYFECYSPGYFVLKAID